MKLLRSPVPWILALALVLPLAAIAQDVGVLSGRIVREDGTAIGGVSIVINELGMAQVADAQGKYRFDNVPAGTYTVTFSLGERVDVEEGVEVKAGETTDGENKVDWQVTFAETVIVVSASRRAERIVDAPAAISVVSEADIERDAATGQLPKLLEFTPGVEMTQGGLYDFNVNTRGFNSSLTRRVAVLIDGRDPSTPFLSNQEWSATSTPLDDIESLEMLRGPGAALYGANASSGIINMVTRSPRGSQGGLVRLIGGSLRHSEGTLAEGESGVRKGNGDAANADFRYAAELGGDWYLKVLGGYRSGDTFTQSRTTGPDYLCGGGVNCLPGESVLPVDTSGRTTSNPDIEGWAGSLRLDKYVSNSLALTLEGGSASVDGAVVQTNVGRVQVIDVTRPWYRFNVNHPRWNLHVSRTERDAPSQLALGSGLNFLLDSTRDQAELQGNWDVGTKGRVVLGGSITREDVDTFDPNRGIQTLVFDSVEAEDKAIFGQFDWDLTDNLKLVLAGRFDESDTFFGNEFSPKAALVYGVNDRNTLRFTYNEGFQAPAIFELFLQVDAALPVDLSPFEGFCSPLGVSCGFDQPTRVLAVGNANLGIEQIEAFEVGYSGVLGGKAFLTVDYYNTQDKDFISDLVSTQFTPLGDYNTVFDAYTPPADLPAEAGAALLGALQSALGPTFLLLSNNFDGTPILAAASYVSFGEVDTQGIDVGLNYYVNSNWTVSANYSWFDFSIKQNVEGLEDLLSPNSPENSIRAGVAYVGRKLDFALSGRWVDEFFWATGPFNGIVESYTTFDASASYPLNDRVKFGLNVSNLLDEDHFETLGGDLIGRRVLGSVEFRW